MRPSPRIIRFSSFCLFGGALALPSSADVRTNLRIRLAEDGAYPVANGQTYAATLELTAPRDGSVRGLRIGGAGWELVTMDASFPLLMHRGETVQVPFAARARDNTKPLKVAADFNGRRMQTQVDLSPARIANFKRPTPVAIGADAEVIPGPPPGERREGGIAGCQTIRLRGRIMYNRADNVDIGADGIWFQIMDEDDGPDEEMFSSYTDTDGRFDVTICWGDCDFTGCDDPDIYLRFECDTGVVQVQRDDLLEEDYSWSTEDSGVFADYTGHDIDFGTVLVTAGHNPAAIHIHNSITRAHRFILENNGDYIPQVDVQWPESDNGAFYRDFFGEIHIGPDETWIEGTHVHEWGHHLLYHWTDPEDSDYCNGFCDTNSGSCTFGQPCDFWEDITDGGGHCLWCRETDHDAWNEGFPNWLGDVLLRTWQPRYGQLPYTPASDGRYNVETACNCCDGMRHDPWITEGYVAALLRDIDDPRPEAAPTNGCTQGTTICGQDALALGADEILNVVREDDPIRIIEFMERFRARYPQFETDLRTTAGGIAAEYIAPNLWPMPPVQIITTPTCNTYRAGEAIHLTVTTNGSRYSQNMQWQRDGANLTDGGRISGATTESLTINNATAADTGTYTLVVSSCDASQTVTSAPMRVSVFGGTDGGHHITGWGYNAYGELGRGSNQPQSDVNPANVLNLTTAVSVSGGYARALAVLADGTAWSWGTHYLGNGTSADSATPVQVNLTDVVAVASGGWQASVALDAHGHVWTWGNNYQGVLGYHVTSGLALNPGQVNLECVTDISMGMYHAAAVTSDGSLWIWGSNYYGELGQGTTGGASETPVRVTDLSNIVDVECGESHTLALRADGTLWACGWNNYGQLGDGTTQNRNRFVQVIGLTNVASMAGGDYHSLARLANGQAWAWGYNGNHTLGTGAPMWANYPTPAPVINVGNVRAVSAGNYLSVFTAMDGTIWTCGSNGSGQLGRPFNNTESGWLPAPVDPRIAAGVLISSGTGFVLAIAPGARINPPLIDQLVAGASTAHLSVSAVGEPPLNYAWYRHGTDGADHILFDTGHFSGVSTATLTFENTEITDSGQYRVRVWNATNEVTSGLVTLSTPPMLNQFNTVQDADWFGNERGNWAITNGSYAAGAPALYANNSYSSFILPQNDFLVELDVVNASILNGDTNGGIYLRSSFSTALPYPRGVALAFGAPTLGRGDVYWHRNYGSGYQVGENRAHSVYTPGQTLHLRIEVRGNTYTCWANDAATPTTTLTTPDFPAGKIALLDGVANGTSFDNVFIQTLKNCDPGSGNEPVRIIQRPQSQEVVIGTQVTLSVTATGTGPLSYRWLRNGVPILSATESSFSFTASPATFGRFECTVSNACGSVGSYPALVTQSNARAGDVSCDGLVNNFDIDPFVLAVANPAAYQAMFPGCPISNADVNGDGVVNNFDIDPFVNCLVHNGCP